MQVTKTISRLMRQFKEEGSTKIRRDGMPNGFFLKNLLWFGDANSHQTAVSRGFMIEPAELDSMDEDSKHDLVDRLRYLLATLGEEYTVQAKLLVGSDYSDVLNGYAKETAAIKDRFRYRWQIWNRTERHARYAQAMEEGKLRREMLFIFFSRVIASQPRFALSESSLEAHFSRLAAQESAQFEQIQGDALLSIFPDCRVRAMTDREHYLHYFRFLNPSCGASVPESQFTDGYDESVSIQENCLFGDIIQPPAPGISFQLDGYNHVVMAMRQLPKKIGPGIITKLVDLGFQDFEISLNLYPQPAQKVIDKLGVTANQLSGEVRTQPKKTYSLSTQLNMATERIDALERGAVLPMNVFFALRLWHRDADTVISRASGAKNAFTSMSGATCHYATNPETARQLWFQTWPGWTFGDYRGYDLSCDDQTAAELLPWSATFTGRLEKAEALYDSPKGGLVGLSTQVGRVPQNMLLFGIVGAGKSILFTDIIAQTLHNFGYVLIVEENNSHGTSVQTAGVRPIIISAGGSTTINYLDPNGLPLSRQHEAGAVALCLQMLRENVGDNVDQSKVSAIQSCLSKHISFLYDTAWEEWSRTHHKEAADIARRAYWIEQYRQAMPGDGNTFLDAWVDFRDSGVMCGTGDESEYAKFSTHHSTRSMVRDLGFASMSSEDMPTHTQLVEIMTLTPLESHDENADPVRIGDRLALWKANGPYGRLFDGETTARMDADVTHFELGLIDDSMEELKAVAHFLVLNVARQQIIKRPRAERKLLVFEEGARMIALPGGAKALKEFYGQMRKFGAVVATVFQQSAALQAAEETVRAAVFDNTKLFIISAQPSPRAAEEICKALELSATSEQTIKRYVLPENQAGEKFSSFLMVAPDARRKLVGTFRNHASREVIYVGASDNEIYDARQKELSKYEDIVEGILIEARKNEEK